MQKKTLQYQHFHAKYLLHKCFFSSSKFKVTGHFISKQTHTIHIKINVILDVTFSPVCFLMSLCCYLPGFLDATSLFCFGLYLVVNNLASQGQKRRS